jgi:NAD(P)-dependent dehydrogenase (short-subunit alcohol dehydrogenase family)
MSSVAASPDELNGHRILGTGADGEGVGRGISEALFAAGGRLVVHGLAERSPKQAEDRWPGCGVVWGDVSDEVAVEGFISSALAVFGGLEGLVNNAGVGPARERLGMRHEGVMREDHFLKGEWASTSVYSLLIGEYADGAVLPQSVAKIAAELDTARGES